MGKVLAVDDDHSALTLVRTILEAAGHQIVTTDSAEQAAGLAGTEKVDAVVLDVVMPGRSGYEVLAQIRHDPILRELPVLMLSNLAGTEDRVRGLREGADDYLGKPLEPEELVLRIDRLIERAAAARADFQGSFEHFSLIELLQQLEISTKSGSLGVECGQTSGTIWLNEGRVRAASLASLRGKEACCAMSQLAEGRFCFEVGEIDPPSDAQVEIPISVEVLVLEEARLMDELYRRQLLVAGVRLWTVLNGEDRVVDSGSPLPLDQVCTWISERPGCTQEEVLSSLLASPRKIDLTLSVLHSGGLLRVETTDHTRTGDVAELSDANDPLPASIEAVLRGAEAQGFAPSLVPVLLAFNREAAPSIGRLVHALPENSAVSIPDGLDETLGLGRQVDLHLRQNVGTVVLKLQPLGSGQARMRAESLLPGCAGVIVWSWAEEDPRAFSWLVPRVELADSVCRGMIITDHDHESAALADLLEGSHKWHIHAPQPSSLAAVLRVFAESLWTANSELDLCHA